MFRIAGMILTTFCMILMTTAAFSISTGSENTPFGYLVRPTGDRLYPAIIMIHEWWGLNENIKTQADILAKEGYVVMAVDLMGGSVATTSEQAQKQVKAVDKEKSLKKMQDAIDFLKTQPYVQKNKIGTIGWCFGGGYALQLAIHSPDIKATVIYYGQLVDDPDELKKIKGPVLGIFGSQDKSISSESVDEFESLLTDLKIAHEVKVYPGVGHAFANPSNKGYHKEFTKDAWTKTTVFFSKYLS